MRADKMNTEIKYPLHIIAKPLAKPLFTTKHYKAIEKLLRDVNIESMTFWEIAGKFRELFVKDNPKFNEAKFAQRISRIGSKS